MTLCANHNPVPCDGGVICLSCLVFYPMKGRELKPSYRTPVSNTNKERDEQRNDGLLAPAE